MLVSTTASPDQPPDTLAMEPEVPWRKAATEMRSVTRRLGEHARSWTQPLDAKEVYVWATEHALWSRPMCMRQMAPSIVALVSYAAGFPEDPPSWRTSTSGYGLAFEAHLVEYHDRINELRVLAEEEGICPDRWSLEHFARFVEVQEFPLRMGAMFLMDDGTYAVVWRNDKWRLTLSFRADGCVEYVLLNRQSARPEGKTGRVSLAGFAELREDLGLESLLKA